MKQLLLILLTITLFSCTQNSSVTPCNTCVQNEITCKSYQYPGAEPFIREFTEFSCTEDAKSWFEESLQRSNIASYRIDCDCQ